MNEQDKFNIDYFLKLITIAAFLFLITNFIFNLGYFSSMGIKYASLLEIKDYYEGTAPILMFVATIFLTLVNALLFLNFIKFIMLVIHNYTNGLRLNCYLSFLLKFKYNKAAYSIKKRLIQMKKELNDINKQLGKYSLEDLLNFIFFVFIFTVPIFQLYEYVYKFSKSSFWILLTLYLFFYYVAIFVKNLISKISITTVIMIIIIGLLGHWAFLRDFNYMGANVTLDNNSQVLLIRPISKGVIVKNKSEIEFYQWNRVKRFSKPIKILKAPDVLLDK